MTKAPNNRLTAILLGLLLVFVQQLGYAHALSHLANPNAPRPSRPDTTHPAEKACSQCLAFAQVGTALAATPAPAMLAVAPFEHASPVRDAVHHPLASPPFLSRAPPR